MIPVHWSVLFALAVGALGCAIVAWRFHQLARCAYGQGCRDQAHISNERHAIELESVRERSYCTGWDDRDAQDRRIVVKNGTVPIA